MFRPIAIATLTAAAFALGTPSAQAACLPRVEQPAAGLGVCVSLVNDCVDANVYYRVLGISGNTTSLLPAICPPIA